MCRAQGTTPSRHGNNPLVAIVSALLLTVLAVIIPPAICSADKYDVERRDPKPVYLIRHWPQDIASVPCSAWKKDDLGAWVLTGTLAWIGGDLRVWRPTYQPTTPEGAIVEKRCAANKVRPPQ
jgi:hypothetical protein